MFPKAPCPAVITNQNILNSVDNNDPFQPTGQRLPLHTPESAQPTAGDPRLMIRQSPFQYSISPAISTFQCTGPLDAGIGGDSLHLHPGRPLRDRTYLLCEFLLQEHVEYEKQPFQFPKIQLRSDDQPLMKLRMPDACSCSCSCGRSGQCQSGWGRRTRQEAQPVHRNIIY